MAELITGRGGTDHVDSEDFGAFNAVTLGGGTYILSGCSMAMKTATTLHIAAGELLMQGRHVRIKGAGEDLDVAVGTTGYNRNDLVALHYKQEGGIESVSVEVVAGTPSTGAASDPELGGGSILNGDAEAYVAIARVPIVGLAPSEPVSLVGGLKSNSQLAESISAIGDSVSPASFTASMMNISSQDKIYGVKAGSIVSLWVNDPMTLSKDIPAWSSMQIATIPDGFRPAQRLRGVLVSDGAVGAVVFDPDGSVIATARNSKLGGNIVLSASYLCD